MSIKKTKIWKFLSSIKLAIWLLSIIAVLSLLGTLIPQNQDARFYIDRYGNSGYQALLNTGLVNVYSSFYFLFLLALFSINLVVCIINRLPLKKKLLGSFFSHISILIIFIGALIGIFFGQKGLIRIAEGEIVNSFVAQNSQQVALPFSIRLDDFIYDEHVDPKERLMICSADSGCIAELPTETGIEMDIAQTGYKITALRYLNDFAMDTVTKVAENRSAMPNNPAIQVRLKDKAGQVSTFWVFARFPDMHQKIDPNFRITYQWFPRRPKDFVSKVTILKDGNEVIKKEIRVNDPLHFDGYTFFQFNYDAEGLKWSGLQIVKDPGVGVVYAGFILLTLGLVMIFYVNPLTRKG